MVWCNPVEAGSLHHQHLLLLQQVKRKLSVAGYIKFGRINMRENIKRPLRFGYIDTINAVQTLINKLPLLVNTTAWLHKLNQALITTQSGLDNSLSRYIGAKAH